MAELKWWEKPIRMGRHEWMADLARVKDMDLDQLAREHAQEWHINCEWIIGTPGIAPGLGWMTTFNSDKFEKYPALGDFDVLREYIPHARKYGIHPLSYLNMHWYSYEFGEAHSDWLQTMADEREYGRVNPLYGSGTTLCVNSGWRDWAFDLVREAMKTGLDGVFLDGPVVYPSCCYCASCLEKFAAQYGQEPPRKEDWSDPMYKEFISFREQSMAAFLRDAGDAMREVNPEGVIFLNAGSWHGGAWRVARDIAAVGPYQNFNGAEAFYHLNRETPMLFWSLAAKHLVAGGKPAIVFVHHCLGAWHYLPLPAIETKVAAAQTVACGSGTWMAVFDYSLDNSREETIAPMREINGFLEECEPYCTAAESGANIALLYSGQSAKFYLSQIDDLFTDVDTTSEEDLTFRGGTGEKIVNWTARKSRCDKWQGDTYQGWFNALTRQHIPFDVILEAGLTDGSLARYDTLIVGNASCLSAEQKHAIADFVEGGGNVVAEFEAGEYDERGNETDVSLRSVLGYESIEGAFAPATTEEYVDLEDAAHPALTDFHGGQWLPRPVNVLKVRQSRAGVAVGHYMNPTAKVYSKPQGTSEWPAAICTEPVGRVIYFAGLFGEFYGMYKPEQIEHLLVGALRWAHGKPMPLRVSAPPTVEAELWRQPEHNRIIVHLVNNTADTQRPMTTLIPITDIGIELDCEGARAVSSARGVDVDMQQIDGGVRLTVPELQVYDLIIVDLQ